MPSIGQRVDALTNVRRRGEDAWSGERVAIAGLSMTPELIGAPSCYGASELAVRTAPAVSLLSTG